MVNRIDTSLREARRAGRIALAPFLTIGYPDLPTSEALVEAVVDSGADLLELGVPFSDPLAEGPTVQKTSFTALQNDVSLSTSIQSLTRLRRRGVEAPLIFMGYYNPILSYGVESFVADASGAGLDGVIVADLPTEESGELKRLCERSGIYLIPLLAPTSTDRRIAHACEDANGFVYCVSVTGVTGARSDLAADLPDLVQRIRRHTDLPVLIGFGISTREHVETVGGYADGAAVGSALLDAIGRAPEGEAVRAAADFTRRLTTPLG